jgi:Carboxypeptidase regulatory-like domain/TonB dependent receptor-like, beta-barrel
MSKQIRHTPVTHRRAALPVVLLAVLLAPVAAIGQPAAANLEGIVTDPSGAVLPGANVVANQPATGFSRETTTNDNGLYRFSNLPVGVYIVKVSLQGFTIQQHTDIQLTVGSTARVDITMALGNITETTQVIAETPLLKTSDGSIGTTVTNEHVENLPLNGRQFANLAVFTPGVQLGFFDDPTKTTTLSINAAGGAGRQVAYNVDGGDNNEDIDGGYTSLYSLEAVREFVVQTQAFKAEYGGSNAAVVNVVTKTGSNSVNGSFFTLFRDDSLNSRTTSEKLANLDKQDYSREQYGGSVGGPIVKDKVFYFAAVERLQQDLSQVFNSQGLFPELDGVYGVPLRQTTAFVKASFSISSNQTAQVRYGYENFRDTQGSAPTVNFDFTGTNTNKYHNVVANHTFTTSSWVNDLTVSYNQWLNAITPNTAEPITRLYPNGISVGWNADSLPQSSHMKKWSIRDDVATHLNGWGGSHDLKFGLTYFDNGNAGGEFSTGRDVTVFRYLDAARDGRINEIAVNGGQGNFFDSAFKGVGFYVQDDWKIGRRLTLNLGVRYDYVDGLELDQTANPLFNFLATQDVPAFAQDPFLQGPIRAGDTLENDGDNLQPRIGFAYDLRGNSRTILRGGVGIYAGFPNGVTTKAFPSIPLHGRFGPVYSNVNQTGIRNPNGSFFRVGDPLPPNQIVNLTLPVFDEIAAPNLEIPQSNQYALAVAHEISPSWVAEAGYIRVETRKNTMRYRANYQVLMPDGTRARRFAPFGFFEPRWRTTICCTFADYNALNVELRGRLGNQVTVNAFYTLASVEGNSARGTDQGRVAGGAFGSTGDAAPDPTNPFRYVGPLETDARHLLSFAGVFTLPHQIVVAPIFRVRSATPYAVFTGRDTNLDGYNFDLPPGATSINSRRGASFSQFDLRITKAVTLMNRLKVEGVLQIFNLFNDDNPSRFNGNMSAAAFGTPTAYAGDTRQPEQRLAELGFRIVF